MSDSALIKHLKSLDDSLREKFFASLVEEERVALQKVLKDREVVEKAETSLREFIPQAWAMADPSKFKGGYHIDALCDHLQAVVNGGIKRLIINIPPRHMKSLAVAVHFPAWTWINHPKIRFLFSSYSEKLSMRDSVKCRRILTSGWYRANWGDRFSLAYDQNQKLRYENDKGGYRLATSVDGATTGEGGDIIVVDDPHNVTETESDTKRNAVLDWWDEAMSSRLNDIETGAYIIVMQRVHENDLVGHILAKNNHWDHLCLPAMFEDDHPTPSKTVLDFKDHRKDGDPLWPDRFSPAALEDLADSMGPYASAGQLQQRPAPREGGMFKSEYFEIVEHGPVKPMAVVRHWDLAATKKLRNNKPAYTAGVKVSLDNRGTFYIEHIARFRKSAEQVLPEVQRIAWEDGKRVMISLPQDPGQAGKFQGQYYVKELVGFTAHARPETGDKITRAAPIASQAEAGNIKIVKGDWNKAFLDELQHFPNGSYKDQVDALSGAFEDLFPKKKRGTITDLKQATSMTKVSKWR